MPASMKSNKNRKKYLKRKIEKKPQEKYIKIILNESVSNTQNNFIEGE